MPHERIDLQAKNAAVQLLAIMIWPADLEARANYRVKAAAWTIAQISDGRVAKKIAGRRKAEIERNYFGPAGGWGRVTAAPSMDAIIQDALATGGKYGRACGEILFNIVTLCQQHPEVRASKNLATDIMVRRAKHEGRAIPDEPHRKTMWKEWGPVAPLWAAYLVCKLVAVEGGISWLSPERLPLIVRTSHWFADFAVGFMASGARVPLLSENAVVRVNPGTEPIKPELPPFSVQQLAWATHLEGGASKKK
jgi:hypothetical protein